MGCCCAVGEKGILYINGGGIDAGWGPTCEGWWKIWGKVMSSAVGLTGIQYEGNDPS